MAYRRFVSYIYEYSGGKKGENRGFVRVEVRNGVCRLGFWMEPEGLPEKNRVRVFGLVRENRQLLGIPLGELLSGSAEIRGQISFSEQQIGKSSYRMDQMGGLLLSSEGGRQFATQWDDEPLRLERMKEWETEHAGPAVLEHSEAVGPKEKSSEDPGADGSNPAAPNVKETSAAERSRQNSSESRKAEVPEHPENTDSKKAVPETSGIGDFRQNVREAPPDEKRVRNLPEKRKIEASEQDAPKFRRTCSQNPAAPDIRRADAPRQNLSERPAAGQKQNRQASDSSRWEQLRKIGTCCQPFHDDQLTDCVKVTRQELWQLRKNGWQMDGSQFQNYGLDRYGHLLLCRDAAQPGVFYIGVPGVFSTNEQFMAGMFGYYNFRPAKPPAEGQVRPKFGYWYRRIPMPEQ